MEESRNFSEMGREGNSAYLRKPGKVAGKYMKFLITKTTTDRPIIPGFHSEGGGLRLSTELTRRTFLSATTGCIMQFALGLGFGSGVNQPTAEGATPAVPFGIRILEKRQYQESSANFLSPERGFYRFFRLDRYGFPEHVDLIHTLDLGWVRESGCSLVAARVSLEDYRYSDLSSMFLAKLENGFGVVRDAGIKVILRFNYNNGNTPGQDTRLEWIVRHIAQLKDVLQKNADVIAVVQAGFIGAWGEWHSSTNGLDNPKARQTILESLLSALPEDRIVQVRTPQYKEELFGRPLDTATAYTGTGAARIGHHNDCILASENDLTYPLDKIDYYTQYVAQDTLFVPIGGETCRPYVPRTNCAKALYEFKRLHYSYLNANYHQEVLDAWKADGCYEEIAARLGYRLTVRWATFPESIRLGEALRVSVSMENIGWAAPFNPRTFVLTLESMRGERFQTPIGPNVRRLLPGKAVALESLFPLTSPPFMIGRYDMYLSAPDLAPRLGGKSEYALSLANKEYQPQSARMLLGSIQVVI